MHERLIAITGGRGSGKTTLIDALAGAGYVTVPEAGRAIITDQIAIGRRDIPATDPMLFAELMLAWDMQWYRRVEAGRGTVEGQRGPVFFDHGVPSAAAFCRVAGRPIPPHFVTAMETFRYAEIVFVAPPWREIYRTDGERTLTFDEAARTHDALVATYRDFGYTLLELPLTDVAARLRFVVDNVTLDAV